MANKDQKRQKDNPQDKAKQENKKFTPPPPKPFAQFSNPNKFKGGQGSKSFNAFHRRLGK